MCHKNISKTNNLANPSKAACRPKTAKSVGVTNANQGIVSCRRLSLYYPYKSYIAPREQDQITRLSA